MGLLFLACFRVVNSALTREFKAIIIMDLISFCHKEADKVHYYYLPFSLFTHINSFRQLGSGREGQNLGSSQVNLSVS